MTYWGSTDFSLCQRLPLLSLISGLYYCIHFLCSVTNDHKQNSIYSLIVYMDQESGHSFTGLLLSLL